MCTDAEKNGHVSRCPFEVTTKLQSNLLVTNVYAN
jgi:hypothetical protein